MLYQGLISGYHTRGAGGMQMQGAKIQGQGINQAWYLAQGTMVDDQIH